MYGGYWPNAGPLSLDDIENNADTCSPRSARAGVYSLARDGEVYRTNPGISGKGVKAIYALNQQETENDHQNDEEDQK